MSKFEVIDRALEKAHMVCTRCIIAVTLTHLAAILMPVVFNSLIYVIKRVRRLSLEYVTVIYLASVNSASKVQTD